MNAPIIPNDQRTLGPLKTSVYKPDRYAYMNRPYLEIFHEWPSKFLHRSYQMNLRSKRFTILFSTNLTSILLHLFRSIKMHLKMMTTALQLPTHYKVPQFTRPNSLLSTTSLQTSPESESPTRLSIFHLSLILKRPYRALQDPCSSEKFLPSSFSSTIS